LIIAIKEDLFGKEKKLILNMNTQEIYQNTLKFAGERHANQKVPGTNANYLLHISNVAMEVMMAHHQTQDFDLDFAIQVAILHDVIEDTETTFEEIKEKFGERIAKAVLALTKNENLEPKESRITDSLQRINDLEKEVAIVKLADRITNLQPPPKHWSKEKIIKYVDVARQISKSLEGKNEYLDNRIKKKILEYDKLYI
jgi:(p)ppGpp synthase/HD superfamily hydrolase